MTRFKKELQKRGFKLEQDYPWLPYEIGSVTIEAIFARIEDARIVLVTSYNVGVGLEYIDRSFNVVDRDFF